MQVAISDSDVERVTAALAGAPSVAYAAPLVYPWSVRSFETKPFAERPRRRDDPLRLYAHIPFCNYRCTFCFYPVRAGAQRTEMERYVAALRRELEWIPPGTVLADLFVGGGTPTALPPDLLAEVLGAIFDRMSASKAHLHTLEASPESVSESHLRVLGDHGIGRVSMGIESMDHTVLATVRRRHSAEQARSACRMIVESGLVLNVDLIYGLPGQTEASFRRDLEMVVASGARSVCLYALRLNRDTPVSNQLSTNERFDLMRLMHWRSLATRSAAELGLVQTHPFTFKRVDGPATAARGPSKSTGDLFGVGMGARSHLGHTVYRNHDRADVYMDRVLRGLSPVETLFHLDVADRKTQYIAATLTDRRSLERAAYRKMFDVSIDDDFGERLDRLRNGGLIRDDGDCISLTDTGVLVYDRVLLCFYPVRAISLLLENAGMLDRDVPAAATAEGAE